MIIVTFRHLIGGAQLRWLGVHMQYCGAVQVSMKACTYRCTSASGKRRPVSRVMSSDGSCITVRSGGYPDREASVGCCSAAHVETYIPALHRCLGIPVPPITFRRQHSMEEARVCQRTTTSSYCWAKQRNHFGSSWQSLSYMSCECRWSHRW